MHYSCNLPPEQLDKAVAVLTHADDIGLASLQQGFTVSITISHGKLHFCMIEQDLTQDVFLELVQHNYDTLEHHGKVFYETPDESD